MKRRPEFIVRRDERWIEEHRIQTAGAGGRGPAPTRLGAGSLLEQ